MGLLSATLRGLVSIAETLVEQAEQEIYNDEAVKGALVELYHKWEAGEVSDALFEAREAELVTRLEEIERHKQQGADDE